MIPLNPALQAWLQDAWSAAHGALPLPARGWSICPRPDLADLTHAGALLAARSTGQPPRALAEAWAAQLPAHVFVERVDVVGPGHLNVKLSAAGWEAGLLNPMALFEPVEVPPPTLVEFVSANPTGPLHLGHARQAVLGDVIARLLRQLGGQVATEFFYNDAGVQIDKLEQSVGLRLKQLLGQPLLFERDKVTAEQAKQANAVLFPADGYHGEYIVDVAQAWLDQGGGDDNQGMRALAIALLQAEQQEDLDALGVHFDLRVSERSLYDQGKVAKVIQALKPFAYQALQPKQDNKPVPQGAQPAWFLETTKWGDDKDRVMVKADGTATYFVPDVAYHVDKWNRGWKSAINLQGSDHHGTLARVQAGVQAVCPEIGAGYPRVIFHTMIKVLKEGQEVKASKRAGDYLTMREVMDQVGVGAFRLAMLEKKPESPMTLNVDVWLAQNATNPVYAFQYAHARLVKALLKVSEQGPGENAEPSWLPVEKALMRELLMLNDRLNAAALDLEPSRVALLAKELSAAANEAYQQGPRVLGLDGPSQAMRVQLYQAAVAGLKTVGEILGVACPDSMYQDKPKAGPSV